MSYKLSNLNKPKNNKKGGFLSSSYSPSATIVHNIALNMSIDDPLNTIIIPTYNIDSYYSPYTDPLSSITMLTPDRTTTIRGTQPQLKNFLDYVGELNKIKKNPQYTPVTMALLNRSIDDIPLVNYGVSGIKHSFTGAGVLLFERNTDPDKCCVILFKCAGLYQDLGGSISPNDYITGLPVSTTAKREAMEETGNYLQIEINLNRVVNNTNIFAEVPVNNPNYRCYAIGLEENAFNMGSFIGNLQKLKLNPYTPKHLIEMDEAQKFYLKDIQTCLQTNSSYPVHCLDATGKSQQIKERTVLILRELMKGYGTNKSVAEIVTNYTNRHQEYKRIDGFAKLGK